MKQQIRLAVLILPAICVCFFNSGFVFAQETGTGGTGGSGILGGQQQNARPEFTGESVEMVDPEFLGDDRRTSINDQSTGAAGGANAFGGGGANPFQAFFGGGGAGGFQGLNSQFGSSQGLKSKVVRAPIVVGFKRSATSRRSTQQIASQVTTTFSRLPRFRGDAINAIASEGQVVLTGTVSSESKKAAAARVARMEPGITQVENQLIVIANEVN